MSQGLPLLDCVYSSSHQQSTNKKSEKVLKNLLAASTDLKGEMS